MRGIDKIFLTALVLVLVGLQILPVMHGHAASLKEINVRAQNLVIEEVTGEIRFEGEVNLEYEGAEMTCRTLILFTDEAGNGDVVRGEATGEVVVSRSGDRLEAGKALFDMRKGVIELEDSPHLERAGNSISAIRIIYEIDSGQARFEGPVRARIISGETGP